MLLADMVSVLGNELDPLDALLVHEDFASFRAVV
jgi:hypothetical protein